MVDSVGITGSRTYFQNATWKGREGGCEYTETSKYLEENGCLNDDGTITWRICIGPVEEVFGDDFTENVAISDILPEELVLDHINAYVCDEDSAASGVVTFSVNSSGTMEKQGLEYTVESTREIIWISGSVTETKAGKSEINLLLSAEDNLASNNKSQYIYLEIVTSLDRSLVQWSVYEDGSMYGTVENSVMANIGGSELTASDSIEITDCFYKKNYDYYIDEDGDSTDAVVSCTLSINPYSIAVSSNNQYIIITDIHEYSATILTETLEVYDAEGNMLESANSKEYVDSMHYFYEVGTIEGTEDTEYEYICLYVPDRTALTVCYELAVSGDNYAFTDGEYDLVNYIYFAGNLAEVDEYILESYVYSIESSLYINAVRDSDNAVWNPTATTVLENGTLYAEDYSFTIIQTDEEYNSLLTIATENDASNTEMPCYSETVYNEENGDISFSGISYSTAGTYYYVMYEEIQENAVDNLDGTFTLNGINYDGTVYYLVVDVEDTEEDDTGYLKVSLIAYTVDGEDESDMDTESSGIIEVTNFSAGRGFVHFC